MKYQRFFEFLYRLYTALIPVAVQKIKIPPTIKSFSFHWTSSVNCIAINGTDRMTKVIMALRFNIMSIENRVLIKYLAKKTKILFRS